MLKIDWKIVKYLFHQNNFETNVIWDFFFLSKVEPSAGTQTCHMFFMFFISSPEPKTQVNFADHNLSVVCRRRCRRKFFKFSSSPEPQGQFQPNLAQSILG